MEENRSFSWSGLFIKIIIVIIFILFTIWLLSMSNKGLSNSLDVLTNNVFSENIEKMKEVGKDYFTTDRLPKKIGEVETLTLEDMYKKNLILKLTDKFGNQCSAKNSYVSVEKYDDEYQMKVYLECGEEKDYIIVIMGCYDYCDSDICEKVEDKKDETKVIEYQYVKTTGGRWTEYGPWSEWSVAEVNKTNYRDIDTKIEKETIIKETTEMKYEYVEREAKCSEGYTVTSDGKKCYKEVADDKYENPTCPAVTGYTKVSQDGFTCTYSRPVVKHISVSATCPAGYTNVNGTCSKSVKTTITQSASCPEGFDKSGNTCVKTNTESKKPVCPTVSGYSLTSREGFTCNYSKTTNESANPVCPTVSGYSLTSREGFTCNYSKTTNETTNPVCPAKSGYIMTDRNGFTCNYSKNVKGDYITTKTGSEVPANTSKYIYEEVGTAEYVYDCENSCAFRWIHTYKVYKAKVEKTTEVASCPTGYNRIGDTCAKGKVEKTTKTASCPAGFTKSGDTCVKGKIEKTTKTASCPEGFEKSGNTCVKKTKEVKSPVCSSKSGYILNGRNGFTCSYSKTTNELKDPICPTKSGYNFDNRNGFTCNYSKNDAEEVSKDAICPEGYTKSGDTCLKSEVKNEYSELIMVCPLYYTDNGTQCYKGTEVPKSVPEEIDVTYYRYRVREYIGGTTDYKWSTSKEDKKLLDAGYELTGRTR